MEPVAFPPVHCTLLYNFSATTTRSLNMQINQLLFPTLYAELLHNANHYQQHARAEQHERQTQGILLAKVERKREGPNGESLLALSLLVRPPPVRRPVLRRRPEAMQPVGILGPAGYGCSKDVAAAAITHSTVLKNSSAQVQLFSSHPTPAPLPAPGPQH